MYVIQRQNEIQTGKVDINSGIVAQLKTLFLVFTVKAPFRLSCE